MSEPIFRTCLRIILRPIAHFCIRRSIGVQDVLEDLKIVFLKVAQEELRSENEELNVSKLSAMTGVHRRDVRRICKHEEEKSEPQNPMTKIIGCWQTHPKFRRKDGRPRVLKIAEDQNEFSDLVLQVNNDLHPGTVLAELDRLGLIEHSSNGVRLLRKTYVSRRDLREAYLFMAEDVQDLITAVEENVFTKTDLPNLHLTTIFDKIVSSAIPEIRQWLLTEGSDLQAKTREYLAQFDCDTNPSLSKDKATVRVVLSTFSLTESTSRNKNAKK